MGEHAEAGLDLPMNEVTFIESVGLVQLNWVAFVTGITLQDKLEDGSWTIFDKIN